MVLTRRRRGMGGMEGAGARRHGSHAFTESVAVGHGGPSSRVVLTRRHAIPTGGRTCGFEAKGYQPGPATDFLTCMFATLARLSDGF